MTALHLALALQTIATVCGAAYPTQGNRAQNCMNAVMTCAEQGMEGATTKLNMDAVVWKCSKEALK